MQSISTRSDLEEERRLFYVAITRAMETVTLSHAETRYKWGNFTITEPSRFLDEIDASLIDKPTPVLFKRREEVSSASTNNSNRPTIKRRNLQPVNNSNKTPTSASSDANELQVGMDVKHAKFGVGKIITIEGNGPNKKATVYFNSVGNKNLLLRFAKLNII